MSTEINNYTSVVAEKINKSTVPQNDTAKNEADNKQQRTQEVIGWTVAGLCLSALIIGGIIARKNVSAKIAENSFRSLLDNSLRKSEDLLGEEYTKLINEAEKKHRNILNQIKSCQYEAEFDDILYGKIPGSFDYAKEVERCEKEYNDWLKKVREHRDNIKRQYSDKKSSCAKNNEDVSIFEKFAKELREKFAKDNEYKPSNFRTTYTRRTSSGNSWRSRYSSNSSHSSNGSYSSSGSHSSSGSSSSGSSYSSSGSHSSSGSSSSGSSYSSSGSHSSSGSSSSGSSYSSSSSHSSSGSSSSGSSYSSNGSHSSSGSSSSGSSYSSSGSHSSGGSSYSSSAGARNTAGAASSDYAHYSANGFSNPEADILADIINNPSNASSNVDLIARMLKSDNETVQKLIAKDRKTYTKLIVQWHPDRNNNDPFAVICTKLIINIYNR